ncbi:MAG: class I SAM-dependent methyltransferase [Rhizobacter sp.]|nr:class I SAM-dependent methyltransferase [Ferruginibacter sp.]
MTKRTFDDFDSFANDYREIHNRNISLSGADSFYFAEMKVKLLQPFENNVSNTILDVGCGDGATQFFMQQYFPAWSIKGIDVSEESIRRARQKNIASAVFEMYDGINIPADESTVDIVFVAGVLHHVNFDLHLNIAREIKRVLKPGGRLYLFEHNPNNPLTKYLVNTCVFDKDARLLKSNYTTRLLKAAAFTVSKKRFIIFFPRKGLLSKLIFLEKYLQWLPLGGQYFIQAFK